MFFTKRLLADESGASLLEYTILIGLLAAATITIIEFIGGWRIPNSWRCLYWRLDGLTEGQLPGFCRILTPGR